jgi:hypothetical protein
LNINTIGVWLPRGFSYTAGSSNLEANPAAPYYSVPVTQSWAGSQVALWSFGSVPFASLPGGSVQQNPLVAQVTFHYTPLVSGTKPDLVPWLTTSGVSDIPYAWDADISVFKITSQAGGTFVDAYTFKQELRQLSSSISGDYLAIGNSLMRDTNNDANGIRDHLDASSDATAAGIPGDADVAAAYLYWSGWISSVQSAFSDSCTSLTNWNYGSPTAWSSSGTYFTGHYSSGGDTARRLTLKTSKDLHTYSAGTATVEWDQWDASPGEIFSDSCSTFNNWTNGSAWNISGSNDKYFSGHYGSGGSTARLLTLKNSLNLSTYSTENVTISWGQRVSHTNTAPGANDGLNFAFSRDGGTTWSADYIAFRGDIGNSERDFSYTVPANYLTSTFKVRFSLVGFNASNQYCNVDDVKITPSLGPGDGLYFSFSGDGGVTWSSDILAFQGDIGGDPVDFSYVIPAQYLTNNFRMRFYLYGFAATGAYGYVDNIKINGMPADTTATFKINGTQVYINGSGQPAQGSQTVTADSSQVFATPAFGGFSYACYKDVTSLVRTYCTKAPDPAMNHPGNSTYTVGSVSGDINNQISYAGWSLIIIYTSPATQGHQLFLYDKFTYSYYTTDMDFDHDGAPGGYISGFIVPNPIDGEQNAAKLTCFVGEGDDWLSGDFVAFNAPESYQTNPGNIPESYKLWDGTSSTEHPGSNTASTPDNVWNGKSVGSSADGVDIDTFNITWASGKLHAGDTAARIDLYNDQDNYNLIYIIISFRSSVKTGNTLSYLIR